MRNWLLFTALCALASVANAGGLARIRSVRLKRNDIALIHTALGIATLIQVPDRPTSVVLGDTGGFKIQYLHNAITIKPLRAFAKSNLYIYTDDRRYNVSLVTVPKRLADYIVYLKPKYTEIASIKPVWRSFDIIRRTPAYTLKLTKIGKSNGLFLIAFQLSAKRAFKFKPSWIWLMQKKRVVPIQELNLSSVDILKNAPVSGFLSVRFSDFNKFLPLVVAFKSPIPIRVILPRVAL